jgi:hypothetical protein
MFELSASNKTASSKSSAKSGTTALFKKTEEGSSSPLVNIVSGGRSASVIQTKLSIGKPDDKYEKEADSVAEQVTAKSSSVVQPLVQLKTHAEKPRNKNQTEEEKDKLQSKAESEEEKEALQKKGESETEEKELVFRKAPTEEKEEKMQKKDEENDKLQTKPVKHPRKDKNQAGLKYVINVNEPDEEPKEEIQTKTTASKTLSKNASGLQRKSSNPEQSTNSPHSNFESNLSATKGSGSPLPAGVRSYMESGFGADFSNVRIHTGSNAEQMSSQINAQAFTQGNNIYFNQGKFKPHTSEGKNLLAHELTHTIQQGAAVQSKQAQTKIQKKNSHSNNNSFIQRSWFGDAWDAVSGAVSSAVDYVSESLEAGLNWIKERFKAFVQNIPGYRLLSVVLGQDPIAGTPVARSGRNFIEAGLDIIPFGNLFKQKLEETGALEEASVWLDRQIATVDISLASILADISSFWNSLSLSDIGNVAGVLERAANIIRRPIGRIITFAANVATEFLRIVKNYILSELVLFIKNNTSAYPLLTVILGKDPITEEPVERSAMNLIRGFILLSPDGEEQLRQMEETGSLQKAADWVDNAVARLDLSLASIRSLFTAAWNLITIENLMSPVETFQRIAGLFAEPAGRIITFVIKVGLKILEFIKDALLARLSNYARETRGYTLITVLLGKDPFTQEVVERSAENIIHGFMSLMDGGEEQFQQMKESGAIQRTIDWIEGAVATLGFTWEYITGLFLEVWNSFSLRDLAAPFEAFARIVRLFIPPVSRLVAFVWEVIKKIIEVLLIIMNFPFNLINNIITKALQAIEDIKRDPIGFLKNILKAIKQGFIQFFDNILKHLLSGLVGWLTSELKDAGAPELKDLSLRGIISWVLEVLGITMEKIWEKLAKHPKIGPERVAKIRNMINTLTGIWEFIKDVQERGIAAIWEKIQEQLTNLWDTIIDSIKNWIMQQIVEKVVTKLLSMLDPTGIMAVINSAIALYKAVQSFIKYLREMLEIVNSFVEGVAEIAKGSINKAADYLERTLARGIPIIIGFLANQVGLSGIGKRIGELIGRAREMVDSAIEWLINKAVDLGSRLLEMGKAAVGKVLGWLGVEKSFSATDGSNHKIYFSGNESGAVIMVESDPKPIKSFLEKYLSQKKLPEAKKKSAEDALSFIDKEIDPVVSKAKKEKDESKKTALEQKLLDLFTTLSDKIRLLLGKEELNKLMSEHKYDLEGLTGTYGSMPKPKSDKFTADHQPQAAIILYAADLKLFKGTAMEKRKSGSHADTSFAINLHKIRHEEGRTFGNKGKDTKSEFVTEVEKTINSSKSDNAKKTSIINIIKKDLQEDVKAIRKVIKKKENFSDLDELGLEDDQKDEMRKKIKDQVDTGENIIESQPLDSLAK